MDITVSGLPDDIDDIIKHSAAIPATATTKVAVFNAWLTASLSPLIVDFRVYEETTSGNTEADSISSAEPS